MIRACANFQTPGMSWPREIRPTPIAPMLIWLLGACAPSTEAGTMVGKPAAGPMRRRGPFRRRPGKPAATSCHCVSCPTRPPCLGGPRPARFAVSVRRWACCWASSTSCVARKQCACDIAVSVRSRTSLTSCAPVAQLHLAGVDVPRFLLIGEEQVTAARASGDVDVLADLDEAVGAEDGQAAVAPGRQTVGREPVHADVPGAAIAAQHHVAEVLEPGYCGYARCPPATPPLRPWWSP